MSTRTTKVARIDIANWNVRMVSSTEILAVYARSSNKRLALDLGLKVMSSHSVMPGKALRMAAVRSFPRFG